MQACKACKHKFYVSPSGVSGRSHCDGGGLYCTKAYSIREVPLRSGRLSKKRVMNKPPEEPFLCKLWEFNRRQSCLTCAIWDAVSEECLSTKEATKSRHWCRQWQPDDEFHLLYGNDAVLPYGRV